MGILNRRQPRRGAIRTWVLLLVLAAGALGPNVYAGQPDTTSDVELKAAFLFNFAKFTEWPGRPAREPLVICIAGDGRVGEALMRIVRGKRIGERDLKVTIGDAAMPAEGCHMFFVSRSEAQAIGPVLARLKPQPILTVSDDRGFARAGGMVELFIERDQMRFMVNPKAAQRAGLQLSSRLLGLARIVDEEHGY